MEDFSDVMEWENFFQQSENFKKSKPCKFAFVENIFKKDFYEKLYDTYPNFDESWKDGSTLIKAQLIKGWGKYRHDDIISNQEDPNVSKEWNKFFRYIHTTEFAENLKKFSMIPVNRLKSFRFVGYRTGGFQAPHTHNVGPSTLIVFFYFSKNWQNGDPGGTYVSSSEDESSIIFEPYNLDNSMVILHDGPYAAHGVRYITKNVERKAIQLYFEEYSSETGWSGFTEKEVLERAGEFKPEHFTENPNPNIISSKY